MFITNEVVRIAWFGVVNVVVARMALPVTAQWGLWVLGVMAAVAFAFAFHFAVDDPIQSRIRRRLKRRTGGRSVAAGPVVSLEG